MNRMSIVMALLVAAPLAAQQPDSMKREMPHEHGEMGMDPMMGQMMMGMMEMMGPMMRTRAFEPSPWQAIDMPMSSPQSMQSNAVISP